MVPFFFKTFVALIINVFKLIQPCYLNTSIFEPSIFEPFVGILRARKIGVKL